LIKIACKTAEKSTFERHRLGAVIVRGHRVMSTGSNSIRYSKEIGKSTLHAEEAAIIQMLKSNRQHLLVGSELYVSRVRPNGTVGLAKPCSRCMDLILSVGISRVHYTTNDKTTETIRC
jgi:deoxycytidylate deaminase